MGKVRGTVSIIHATDRSEGYVVESLNQNVWGQYY